MVWVSSARPVVATVALLLGAHALSGCAKSCTAVGAEDGVALTAVGYPADAALSVKVCRGTTCASTQLDLTQSDAGFVALRLTSTTAQALRVSVRTAAGPPVLEGAAISVVPVKIQPNGPDCDPTAYQAGIRVSPTGVVSSAPSTAPS